MKIYGLDSILYASFSVVWPNEPPPNPLSVTQFEVAASLLQQGKWDEIEAILDQLDQMQLLPSQRMRVDFLRGERRAGQHEWHMAQRHYVEAFVKAERAGDFNSMLSLLMDEAKTWHDLLDYAQAKEYYQSALDAWHEHTAHLLDTPIEPEITFVTYLSRQEMLLGEFDEAHARLALAITALMRNRTVAHNDEITRMHGNALWTLGLVMRSQSDMLDGQSHYLYPALRRFKRAAELYSRVGELDSHMGRLYIQLAETYLDLTELHVLHGSDAFMRTRQEANNYVTAAIDFLKHADNDPHGQILARLASLRWRITRPIDAALNDRAFEDDIAQLEQDMKADSDLLSDRGLAANAASLRAEWYLLQGNYVDAKSMLAWAISGFSQHGGLGMATRTRRLQRRIASLT
jgi:tetratricopeptide (TPR) repeat protein